MASTTGMEDLGHVRHLVERGLCPDEDAAARFLADLGVRHARGIFSWHALARALEAIPPERDEIGGTDTHRQFDDAESCLRDGLAQFDLRVASFTDGRTKLATIVATEEPRTIVVETSGVPLLIDAEHGVQARVYVGTTRRTGQVYFLAGGFKNDTKSAIYLFVFPREGRFWIALRSDLLTYEAELRAAAKGQRGRRRYPQRAGFAPHKTRKGYLRVWMGLAGLPGLEPGRRIADAEGRFFPGYEHSMGGRP